MKSWLRRFGVVGFLFFLVKGLAWLIVPAALVAFGFAGNETDGQEPPVQTPTVKPN